MKRFLALLLCGILMLPLLSTVCLADGKLVEHDEPIADTIEVSAYAAIVLDAKTGEPLFEYDADEKNYPASTTKVMTAYLCLKYGNPNDIVTVSKTAFSDITAVASTGDLVVGEEMTVHRLLQALLVVSASEAANVVGEYISGDHEKFVDLMNEEAKALGCTGTHFANCHGLPNRDHYTTARDMAKIASAAMEYQEFREIVGSAYTTMEATNKSSAKRLQSTNGILPGSSYTEYNYPYATGIKTGHTNDAGFCLISSAEKDDVSLICVIMGCSSRLMSFAETINLYDWAFDNYEALTFGKKEKYVQTADLSTEIDAEAQEDELEGIVTESSSNEDSITDSATDSSKVSDTPVTIDVPVITDFPTASSSNVQETMTVTSTQPSTGTQLTLSDLTIANLTGPLLPLLIFFIIIAVLVILLIITITIAIKRHNR